MKKNNQKIRYNPFSPPWLRWSMIAVWFSAVLLLPLASQAKDGGIENLRQTSKAFAEVAKELNTARHRESAVPATLIVTVFESCVIGVPCSS